MDRAKKPAAESCDCAGHDDEAAKQPQAEDGKDVQLSAEAHRQLTEQAELAANYKDQLLRAVADFDNARKRMQRDREEFTQFASERLLKSLLPIMDSFDLALSVLETPARQGSEGERADAMGGSFARGARDGIKLIHRQLLDLLDKEGVKRIAALNQPFDHQLHDAVQQVERSDIAENTVVDELQAGYTLNGRVLRPAMVKVSKHPTTTTHSTDTQPADGATPQT